MPSHRSGSTKKFTKLADNRKLDCQFYIAHTTIR